MIVLVTSQAKLDATMTGPPPCAPSVRTEFVIAKLESGTPAVPMVALPLVALRPALWRLTEAVPPPTVIPAFAVNVALDADKTPADPVPLASSRLLLTTSEPPLIVTTPEPAALKVTPTCRVFMLNVPAPNMSAPFPATFAPLPLAAEAPRPTNI